MMRGKARTSIPISQSLFDRLTMTTKDKVIQVMQSLNDDVTLDEVIDRLYLLRKIELGIAQADSGDVMDHDSFMDELEREDAS